MHEQSRVRDAFNLNSRHRRVYRSGRRVLYRDPHSNSAAFMIRWSFKEVCERYLASATAGANKLALLGRFSIGSRLFEGLLENESIFRWILGSQHTRQWNAGLNLTGDCGNRRLNCRSCRLINARYMRNIKLAD